MININSVENTNLRASLEKAYPKLVKGVFNRVTAARILKDMTGVNINAIRPAEMNSEQVCSVVAVYAALCLVAGNTSIVDICNNLHNVYEQKRLRELIQQNLVGNEFKDLPNAVKTRALLNNYLEQYPLQPTKDQNKNVAAMPTEQPSIDTASNGVSAPKPRTLFLPQKRLPEPDYKTAFMKEVAEKAKSTPLTKAQYRDELEKRGVSLPPAVLEETFNKLAAENTKNWDRIRQQKESLRAQTMEKSALPRFSAYRSGVTIIRGK